MVALATLPRTVLPPDGGPATIPPEVLAAGRVLFDWLYRDPPPAEAEGGPASHSPGFDRVNWYGTEYVFTPMQRLVVAELWRRWESGGWPATAAELLAAAGSDQRRLRDLFDQGRHPAWGTMVASPAKGAYALAPIGPAASRTDGPVRQDGRPAVRPAEPVRRGRRSVKRPAPPPAPVSHSDDFARVVWHGLEYVFDERQRRAVARIWQAWRDGTRFVPMRELLGLTGTPARHLREVFADHPAWGSLIDAGGSIGGPAGCYCLIEPADRANG